jgi:hypothetical protein
MALANRWRYEHLVVLMYLDTLVHVYFVYKHMDYQQVWNEYFVHRDTRISFVEHDQACATKWGGGITRGEIYIGKQEDPAFMKEIVDKNTATGFDIIVDDGGHTWEMQQFSFSMLWPLINPGGLYFIEDLETSYETGYYASAGFNSTIEYIKGAIDTLNCKNSKVPCSNIERLECSKQICVFQKAY